jgi:hypothetical protein
MDVVLYQRSQELIDIIAIRSKTAFDEQDLYPPRIKSFVLIFQQKGRTKDFLKGNHALEKYRVYRQSRASIPISICS